MRGRESLLLLALVVIILLAVGAPSALAAYNTFATELSLITTAAEAAGIRLR